MLSTFLSSFLFFVFASIFRKPSAKKTFIVKDYKKNVLQMNDILLRCCNISGEYITEASKCHSWL